MVKPVQLLQRTRFWFPAPMSGRCQAAPSASDSSSRTSNAFFRPPPRHLHSLHIDIHIIFKWLFIHSFYGLRQTKHSMCTDMLNILCRWTSCSLWSHGKHSWEKITNYGKCLAVEKAAAGASSEQNYNRKSVPAYSAVFHYVVTSCLQNELERRPN